jgi:hypothetical protein
MTKYCARLLTMSLLDTMSPAQLVNWITNYELIEVALTLVGVAAPHRRGREYKKANANLNTRCPTHATLPLFI